MILRNARFLPLGIYIATICIALRDDLTSSRTIASADARTNDYRVPFPGGSSPEAPVTLDATVAALESMCMFSCIRGIYAAHLIALFAIVQTRMRVHCE